jgi:uncharacterized protein YecT (DUF1311 family)
VFLLQPESHQYESELTMIRRLFQFSTKRGGMFSEQPESAPPATSSAAGEDQSNSGGLPLCFDSFEKIYGQAVAGMPPSAYSILKVAEMINSPHLAGMSTEFRRGSVMMALEAAGVHITDILQDAMLRQQALEQYEEVQQKTLREFEAFKGDINRKLQADMDRLNSEYMSKIQSNIDEVARQQDALRAWLKAKQAESSALSSASAYCTPSGGSMTNAFSVVIEHQARR